jgi:hypothetical protein
MVAESVDDPRNVGRTCGKTDAAFGVSHYKG